MLSMTGFGKGEAEFDGIRVTAEISSVNRKQFELRVSAPSEFSEFEPLARRLVAEEVSRGSIQLKIGSSASAATAGNVVDAGFLAALIEAACRARREAGLDHAVQVEQLMMIPRRRGPMRSRPAWPPHTSRRFAPRSTATARCANTRARR